ncbi:hypothetical protein [Paenibacillus polymyxa]|uniref:hypothetical protein n=1 Tax=Paenibacillus polymyxa TaxID=1406 RepID=UPI003F84B3D1
MFRLYSDLRGAAYERLIDYAMERADTFMLGIHKWATEDENGVIRLKSLRISCGCYDRPAPDVKVIPKEELAFRHLPPEIQNLNNLRSLDIVNGFIESAPDFIYKMTWLDRFLIEDKPFHLCNHGDD